MNTVTPTAATVPTGTIDEFATAHDLTMLVDERDDPTDEDARFYARFADCQECMHHSDGTSLLGTCGNGDTPESAIQAYAKRTSLRRIVIDAYEPTRREIDVWRLVEVSQRHDPCLNCERLERVIDELVEAARLLLIETPTRSRREYDSRRPLNEAISKAEERT
jgi:hypothetical protein